MIKNYGHTIYFYGVEGSEVECDVFTEEAIKAINKNREDKDILLCPLGNYQKPISDAVHMMTIEPGIGYSGVFCSNRVFESYAWMHHVYGLMGLGDGSWYDAVIPNYFNVNDFPYQEKSKIIFFILEELSIVKE